MHAKFQFHDLSVHEVACQGVLLFINSSLSIVKQNQLFTFMQDFKMLRIIYLGVQDQALMQLRHQNCFYHYHYYDQCFQDPKRYPKKDRQLQKHTCKEYQTINGSFPKPLNLREMKVSVIHKGLLEERNSTFS